MLYFITIFVLLYLIIEVTKKILEEMLNQICSKCGVPKELDDFYTYTRTLGVGKKGNGRLYRRKVCFNCFNEQTKTYKLKKKMERTTLILIEIPTKYCSGCSVDLPLDSFYKNQNHCKDCQSDYDKKYRLSIRGRLKQIGAIERRRDRGENGYGLIVNTAPGYYANERAKRDTFWAMTTLGWIYNQDTGIWAKEGIKNKFNEWEFQK